MKLRDALIRLCNENINQTNDWYSWRTIDEAKLPSGISLPEGNHYQKNIALKVKLNQLWLGEHDITRQEEVIKYYISTWGGVRGNKSARISEYASQLPDQLIGRGKGGVASWSKALVVRDPNQYAIFDARVSVSLNCLQILDNTDIKTLYPVLPSQNKSITHANARIKEIARVDGWNILSNSTFYESYLSLIRDVARECQTDKSTVEMLLFSKAIDLARAII